MHENPRTPVAVNLHVHFAGLRGALFPVRAEHATVRQLLLPSDLLVLCKFLHANFFADQLEGVDEKPSGAAERVDYLLADTWVYSIDDEFNDVSRREVLPKTPGKGVAK